MKRILLVVLFCLSLLSAQSQQSTDATDATVEQATYMKGDMLLSLDVQAVKIVQPADDAIGWEGMPIRVGFEYFFYNKGKLYLSSGLNAIYLRHQPGDGHNYGALGLAVPINFHFTFVRRLDTYLGYKIGYYFDGYNPPNDAAADGYEGLYSDLYLGARYFLTPKFAVYTEISADAGRLYGGISYKF